MPIFITTNQAYAFIGPSIYTLSIMPPLGIFGRGRSPSPSPVEKLPDEKIHASPLGIFGLGRSPGPPPVEKRQDEMNASFYSAAPTSNARGIFRGLSSSRHDNTSETISAPQDAQDPAKSHLPEAANQNAEMEVEYLNIISTLSKEKRDASDEIEERRKESNVLSTSNRNLQSTVADLEAKLAQLSAKQAEQRDKEEAVERPPVTPQSGKRRPVQRGSLDAQVFTFSSPNKTEELESIKEQLRENNESNLAMNSRVQRIRDKYAQRRAESEDMSDTSSVGSINSVRSCVSMVTSPLSSPRHHLVEVKKMERSFEKEIQRNGRLEQSIKKAEEDKAAVEMRLVELSKAAEANLGIHNAEIENLKSQLTEATAKLEESEKAVADLKEGRDKDDLAKDNELADLTSKLTEQSIKVAELQNEINVKEAEIRGLRAANITQELQRNQDIDARIATQNAEIERLQLELSSVQQKLEEAEKAVVPIAESKTEDRNDIPRALEAPADDSKVEEESKKVDTEQAAVPIAGDQIDIPRVLEAPADDSKVEEESKKVDTEKADVPIAVDQNDIHRVLEAPADDSKVEEERKKIMELEESIKQKEQEIETAKADIVKQSKMKEEMAQLKDEIAKVQEELKDKDEQLAKLIDESNQSKEKLSTMELDFIVSQEKSARVFEELEDLKDKYDAELERNVALLNQLQASPVSATDTVPASNITSELLEATEKKVKYLEGEIEDKEKQISALDSTSGRVEELQKELESIKADMTILNEVIEKKNKELEEIRNEKDQSFTKLETIEQDFMAIQMKNSTTFEQLEDLQERYDHELHQKNSLQEKLDSFSPDEILAEAKKESDQKLKARDSEIHDLKKHLIDANMAKTDIELKLMEVMNDVISSQSTRNVMKGELETRLNEENEKAFHLEDQINAKEEDMERMRREFDNLRIQMEKETDVKRNEISELNGEVVEKSSQLSSKDRDFLLLRAQMDDMRLQHATEVAHLQRQIEDFGANEIEVQRMRTRNMSLENEVATLKNEIQKIHMNGPQSMTEDSTVRVLRTRNEQLKGEVEKYQRKLRRMKRNVTRIEL